MKSGGVFTSFRPPLPLPSLSLSSQLATPYCYCLLQVLFSSLSPPLQPCTTNRPVWAPPFKLPYGKCRTRERAGSILSKQSCSMYSLSLSLSGKLVSSCPVFTRLTQEHQLLLRTKRPGESESVSIFEKTHKRFSRG